MNAVHKRQKQFTRKWIGLGGIAILAMLPGGNIHGDNTSKPLKGFYVGLGTGVMGLHSSMDVHNTTSGTVESGRPKIHAFQAPLQFSMGYEKTVKEKYIVGIEATYTHGTINAKANETFDDAAMDQFGVTNTIKARNMYGLNVSFGRQFNELTPYIKVGLASTEFTAQSVSYKNAHGNFNGSQRKRLFGMATGIGLKYALNHRTDFVIENMWTFYQPFTTKNFSNGAGDNHSFKVNPLLYALLIGIRLKF